MLRAPQIERFVMRQFSLSVLTMSGLLLAACGGETSSNALAATEAAAKNDAPANVRQAVAATDNDENPSRVQSNDMVLGDENAPVTVIEYASVTCPHCATFHKQIFPEIKKNFVETGKVKFVFREFPTSPARLSIIGSVLARCAADKGGSEAYFLVLGSLFNKQRDWAFGDDPKGELLKITAQAGIDEPAFDACLKRQELIDLVQENTQTAVDAFEVSGTPTFIVDGEKVNARSAEDFEKTLKEAYEKATS